MHLGLQLRTYRRTDIAVAILPLGQFVLGAKASTTLVRITHRTGQLRASRAAEADVQNLQDEISPIVRCIYCAVSIICDRLPADYQVYRIGDAGAKGVCVC